MDFKNPQTYLEGSVLFMDKPLTWTSFDLVNKVRQSLKHHLGIQKIKVGHAGTLDPLAPGLVIICTGKATKQMLQYQDMEKAYEAQVRLGATTPSFDLETEVDKTYPWEHITPEMLNQVLDTFLGDQEQMAPIFSAKSVDGKRAYVMARKGKTVELKPHQISIKKIETLSLNLPDLSLLVECSKGTYIRSLARDIGGKLDSGGHLTGLRRTRIGPYTVGNAISIENFLEKIELL